MPDYSRDQYGSYSGGSGGRAQSPRDIGREIDVARDREYRAGMTLAAARMTGGGGGSGGVSEVGSRQVRGSYLKGFDGPRIQWPTACGETWIFEGPYWRRNDLLDEAALCVIALGQREIYRACYVPRAHADWDWLVSSASDRGLRLGVNASISVYYPRYDGVSWSAADVENVLDLLVG